MGEKDNERTNMSDDQEYLLYNLSSRKTLAPNQGWYRTNNQYAMPNSSFRSKSIWHGHWTHAGNKNAISIPFWIWLGVWLLLFGQLDTFTLASTIWLLWLVSWGLIACQLCWLSSSLRFFITVCVRQRWKNSQLTGEEWGATSETENKKGNVNKELETSLLWTKTEGTI